MMDDFYLKNGRPVSTTAFFVKWINVIALLLSLAVISLGIWLATRPGDCEKYLTVPVFLVGAFFLLVSVLGIFGAWFAIVPILYTYLVLLVVTLVGFFILTIFIFAVTSPGGGYTVNGLTFKEYKLSSYSSYVQSRLNKASNWDHLEAVIEYSDNCANFETISPVDYPYSDLNPIQSGCCRPPSECGFAMTSAGTFNTNSTSQSSNTDCTLYSNDSSTRCYSCDSCKGGVAQDLKKTGRVAGIVCIVILLILVVILSVACTVGHRAAREYYGRV